MSNCCHCHQEIKEGSMFCPLCGKEQIAASSNMHSSEERSSVQSFEQIQSTFNQQIKSNEKIQQLTTESKNYFGWLNENVKSPKALKNTNNPLFSFINFCLISLFFSLAFSGGVIAPTMYYSDKWFPYFFEVLLAIVLILLIGVLVVYVTTSQIYKEKITFLQAFDRVYAPASIAVYISLAALVFSVLMSTYSVVFSLLLFIPIILVNISVSINIYATPDKTQKINRYYATLLILSGHVILTTVVFFIIGDTIAANVFESFFNLF